jgi:hypothetical protein
MPSNRGVQVFFPIWGVSPLQRVPDRRFVRPGINAGPITASRQRCAGAILRRSCCMVLSAEIPVMRQFLTRPSDLAVDEGLGKPMKGLAWHRLCRSRCASLFRTESCPGPHVAITSPSGNNKLTESGKSGHV